MHTHTDTHLSSTSESGFCSISFFHQSLSQSVSAARICPGLICIPGWWGNSSLGLPLTADPNPSQTTGPVCAFIILMLQSPIQQNLTVSWAGTRCRHIWNPGGWMCYPCLVCMRVEIKKRLIVENVYLVYSRWEPISSPFHRAVVSFLYELRAHPYADG